MRLFLKCTGSSEWEIVFRDHSISPRGAPLLWGVIPSRSFQWGELRQYIYIFFKEKNNYVFILIFHINIYEYKGYTKILAPNNINTISYLHILISK